MNKGPANASPIIPAQRNRKKGYDNPYQNVDPSNQVKINEAPRAKSTYDGNVGMAKEIPKENEGEKS